MLQSNSQMSHSQLEAGIERKEKKTVNITLKNIVSLNQFQHIVWIYLYCKIIYVNCGRRNEYGNDPRSY